MVRGETVPEVAKPPGDFAADYRIQRARSGRRCGDAGNRAGHEQRLPGDATGSAAWRDSAHIVDSTGFWRNQELQNTCGERAEDGGRKLRDAGNLRDHAAVVRGRGARS